LLTGELNRANRVRILTLAVILAATAVMGGCVGITRQSPASSATTGTSATGTTTPAGAAVLSVSSPSVSFGNVPVGSATSTLLSLTNSGAAILNISGVSVSGDGYSVSGGSSVALMPAQSVTVSVNFGPTSTGYAAGTLSVSSNAQNSVVQVAISGTGITAQVGTHSVTLSWTPSASQVGGYYIYRSSISGGPYAKLNTTLDPASSYTDAGLTSGSYFYVVTSVDPNGVESGYSNEVAVTIP
jgi:centrosomal CEP192-like protein